MHTPYLSEFLTLAALHLAVVVSPGPNLTLVAKNSILMHRTLALYCVLGIAAGAFLHVCLAIAGISAFVKTSPTLYATMQFIGAAYLIYVGCNALKTRPYHLQDEVARARTALNRSTAFTEGFINMMSNPKAYLFMLALFTQVVGTTPVSIKLLYGFWMSLVDTVWFGIIALVLSTAAVKARFTAKLHYLARAFGLVLIGFGIAILIKAFG